jgi:hypothetical protein
VSCDGTSDGGEWGRWWRLGPGLSERGGFIPSAVATGGHHVTTLASMATTWKKMPDKWAPRGEEVANRWNPLEGISRFK